MPLDTVKRAVRKLPFAEDAYALARSVQGRRQGAELFENVDDYARALYRKDADGVVLRTHDGLQVAIRRNRWDAEIVREIFFDRPYIRHVDLPAAPVIVDIGGYIGDFALYAVKYLKAAQVVVYEPTLENFEMLTRNVQLNRYGDRIKAVNQAVGLSGEIVLNVQKLDSDEIHVSSHWYGDAERRTIPSVSLAELFDTHRLEAVDLLKVDCEGGEYDILADTPDDVLGRVRNIVFEYHTVDGYQPKLDRVMHRLAAAGYRTSERNKIVSATRR